MDVATAFLYADLEEETFVDILEGVALVGEGDMLWRLRKCLYGLKLEPDDRQAAQEVGIRAM